MTELRALFISAHLSSDAVSAHQKVRVLIKLQALVYDILPSTTAVFSYAIGSKKQSANEQFFIGAQTVIGLLQTTQIKQDVSFIAVSKAYISTNKTTIVWIDWDGTLFFTRGGCVSCLRACYGARLLLQSYYHISRPWASLYPPPSPGWGGRGDFTTR